MRAQTTISLLIFSIICNCASCVNPPGSVTKRYDLSFQDLERMNWTVVYPSDAGMKEIKMYPK